MKYRMLKYHLTLLLLAATLLAFSQNKLLKFEHLNTNDGLSQSNVLKIIQDSRGFMWFATRDGLNRYDGYNFTVYKNDPKNKNSISNNSIADIIESANGDLWLATSGGGLNRFNRAKGIFSCYKHDAKNPNSIASDLVTALCEDNQGNLWVGTESEGLDMFDKKNQTFTHYKNNKNNLSISGNFIRIIYSDKEKNLWIGTTYGGLNLFNAATKTFTRFLHNNQDPSSVSSNDVYVVFEDNKDRMWIGTNGGGLDLFDKKNNKFSHYTSNSNVSNRLPKNEVYAIAEDAENNIWVGTENGGLAILDPAAGTFSNYVFDAIDNSSLSNNSIYSICRDNKDNMWVGTFSGGISYLNRDNQFAHYKHTSSPNSISDNNVLCILEDSKKNIWIGTDGGGLNLYDPVTGKFTNYLHDPANVNSICGNYVLSVHEDDNHNLWIGTWGDGITVFNKEKNTFKHFKNDPANPNSLSSNNAWTIYEDEDKKLWVGTFGGGINLYNPATSSFTRSIYDEGNTGAGINSYKISSIFDDKKGHLWFGTNGGGLNMLDKKSGVFKYYMHDDNKTSLLSNVIGHLYQDRKGILWIATASGLSALDPQTGNFTNYTSLDGLPNDNIFGILEDDKNNLWISTSKGISCFNPSAKTFKNYSVVDGLQGNEFKEQAFCKSSTGAFYFGGNNGFNVFYPNNIAPPSFEPPLVLTNFRIFNKEVPVATDSIDSPLKSDISEIKTLTLPYSSSVIEFEFASLNYVSSEKKQYAYKLEGFDKDWNYVDSKRTATYTHLDPAKYVFKVKGLNNKGEWSANVLSIELNITPPFWLTWWFKFLVVLSITGGCIGFYKIRMRTIKAQKKVLELKVEERTQQLKHSTEEERISRLEADKARQEAEQANKAKSVFLATMSHEIRTPMNGVIGMADLLTETELDPEQKGYAEVIRTCGESLLNVINDILDFSKIESGKMELENADFDLRTCIEEVLDVFAIKAAQLRLDLVYQIDHNVPSRIIGDSLRIRQILMNLVGNAIKFTKQGEIFISVQFVCNLPDGQMELLFSIKDTGIGIPHDKIDRLFKAFSQVDSSTTRKYGGTGLGLVICEKLITLMGGNIKVESEYGEGTTFSFNIKTAASLQASRTYVHNNMAGMEKKRILVVDDNSTNLRILKNQLEQWKLIPVLTSSGNEALQLLSAGPGFDLVITDMQMPDMDGIDVANSIRAGYPAIPIILLSSIGDETYKQYPGLFASILTKPVKQNTLYTNLFNELKQNNKTIAVKQEPLNQSVANEFGKHNPLNILVAEDNVTNQFVVIKYFNKLGYSPDTAKNGKQALDMATAKNYDIIFMDVQMPEMDGLEVTELIRSTINTQPIIIALTANAMQEDREQCLQSGMNDYLSKPVKLNELAGMLKKWAQKVQV